MDYSVGSLSDLISGTQTHDKVKVIKKSFTPIKEPTDPPFRSKKVPVIESEDTKSFAPIKQEPTGHPFKKIKKRSTITKSKPLQNDRAQNSLKPKGKKREYEKADESTNYTEEVSPKIPKLSGNEKNAFSRIKSKINKDFKNSSAYRDKTLFVGNIPINVKKKQIKKHFSKYGPIDSVRLRGIPVADPKTSKKVAAIKKEFHPERNTVYAFIRFLDAEDAKKAEVENGNVFLEHHLRVQYCVSDDKPDESKAIFVGNLSFKAEEEDLWNLFKPCGPISHVRIVRDGRTNMGKGFAFVNFKDSDSVQLALEMEKVTYKDRELRITLCESNRAKSKKNGQKRRAETRNSRNQSGDKEATSKTKHTSKGTFTGTKFNIKKKKKIGKGALKKKLLSKKLLTLKPEKDVKV